LTDTEVIQTVVLPLIDVLYIDVPSFFLEREPEDGQSEADECSAAAELEKAVSSTKRMLELEDEADESK